MRFGVTGEVSRDRLSQPGLPTWQGLGGCAVYLSLALGRLGAAVIFATLAGDDLEPDWLAPLHQAGVDLRLRQLAGPTARLELAYDPNGDIARLRFRAGVERHLDLSHLPPDFWSADWILVGTGPREYQAAVIRHAAQLGRSVALSTQREFDADWDSLATLLPHLAALFINSGEAVDLRGDALPAALAAMRAVNPHLTCVLTCGQRGAFLLHQDWLHHVTACPGEIVSTTGAGDAFAAAWLLSFVRACHPQQALRVAAAAASLALRGPAHTTLPGWQEIEQKLEAHGQAVRVEGWPTGSVAAQATLLGEDAACHRPLRRRVARS